jgi:hypothetical protein
MVEALGPALDDNGDRARVADLVAGLWSRGTGADLQRADLQRADLTAGGGALGVVRAAASRAVS